MARPAKGQVVVTRGKRDTTYALRFRAYGQRRYLTLGSASEGWSRERADQELQNVLADIRRHIWQPALAPATEVADEEPDLHHFASAWVERRRHEVDERTVEHWRWACTHFLGYMGNLRPSQIGIPQVEAYKAGKLREREILLEDLAAWESKGSEARGARPPRPLSNRSINSTLTVLGQLLDEAIDLGYLATNPARGKKRRLNAAKPKRTWLEAAELNVLLDAAGTHRALIATMALAGLRCPRRARSSGAMLTSRTGG